MMLFKRQVGSWFNHGISLFNNAYVVLNIRIPPSKCCYLKGKSLL